MKIKKGDKVKIISGKDRGKTGTVKLILKKTDRVLVEGINIVTKHQKAKDNDKPKGIIKVEAPIHISNVMVLDPKNDKPSRVGYIIKENKKVRISKKTQTALK